MKKFEYDYIELDGNGTELRREHIVQELTDEWNEEAIEFFCSGLCGKVENIKRVR